MFNAMEWVGLAVFLSGLLLVLLLLPTRSRNRIDVEPMLGETDHVDKMTAARHLFAITPILVINLERKPERRDQIRARLGPYARNAVFLKATDAQQENAELVPVKEGLKFKRAEVACYTSHLRALQTVVRQNWNLALILEDDAMLRLPDMEDAVANFLAALPLDGDGKKAVGILGLHNVAETSLATHFPGASNVGRLTNTLMGAHAYFVTKAAAEKMIEIGSVMADPFDLFIGNEPVKSAVDVSVIVPSLVGVNNVYDSSTNVEDPVFSTSIGPYSTTMTGTTIG